jgi:hypothetical protein
MQVGLLYKYSSILYENTLRSEVPVACYVWYLDLDGTTVAVFLRFLGDVNTFSQLDICATVL